MPAFRLNSLHAQNHIMNKLCEEENAYEAEYARKKSRGIDEASPDMQALRSKIAEATKKSYDAFAAFKKIYDQDKPDFHGLQLDEIEKYHVAKVKFILGQIQILPVVGRKVSDGDLRDLHRQLREELKQERQLLVRLLLRSAEAYEKSTTGSSNRDNQARTEDKGKNRERDSKTSGGSLDEFEEILEEIEKI